LLQFTVFRTRSLIHAHDGATFNLDLSGGADGTITSASNTAKLFGALAQMIEGRFLSASPSCRVVGKNNPPNRRPCERQKTAPKYSGTVFHLQISTLTKANLKAAALP